MFFENPLVNLGLLVPGNLAQHAVGPNPVKKTDRRKLVHLLSKLQNRKPEIVIFETRAKGLVVSPHGLPVGFAEQRRAKNHVVNQHLFQRIRRKRPRTRLSPEKFREAIDDSDGFVPIQNLAGFRKIPWINSIVGVQGKNVWAFCMGDSEVPRGGEASVFRPENPGAGMLIIREFADGLRIVGTVVHDHDFDVGMVLRQNGIDGFVDEATVVEARDDDGDKS